MKKVITQTHIESKAENQAWDEARKCPHCSRDGEYLDVYTITETHYKCSNCATSWYVENNEVKERAKEIEKILRREEMLSKK